MEGVVSSVELRLKYPEFGLGGKIATAEKQTTITLNELPISSLTQTDAHAKLVIEKGIITQQEFFQKIAEKRATSQRILNPTAL
jgi:hypothetical protein